MIKLLLLKSGEDMIADVSEMTFGEGEDLRVVGYQLNRPCVVKMARPNVIDDGNGEKKKAGYEVSLFPWIPLSAEETIPVPADWVVTMVNPAEKLKQMYIEDIVKYGKGEETDQDPGTDQQSDSDQSD